MEMTLELDTTGEGKPLPLNVYRVGLPAFPDDLPEGITFSKTVMTQKPRLGFFQLCVQLPQVVRNRMVNFEQLMGSGIVSGSALPTSP